MNRNRSIALALVAAHVFAAGCAGPPGDDDSPRAAAAVAELSENSVVYLSADAQERIGVQTHEVAMEDVTEERKAYGRLEEDPSLSFIVRAPIAGVVRTPQAGAWPTIGMPMVSGTIIGRMEPRYSPTDQINLADRRIAAQAEVRSATAAVTAAEAAYERTRVLNGDNKNVSDRALQEAAARLAAELANLEGAKNMLSVAEFSHGAGDPSSFVPLTVSRGGEVTEILALPGEDVAAGTPLVRVTAFDSLLANISLPIGEQLSANIRSARIVPVGHEKTSIPATLVAVNPSVDPSVQGQSLLLRLSAGNSRLRPGQAVTAYFTVPGETSRAIVIPSSAVVHHVGESFAYVRESADEFVRRRLIGLSLTPVGYSVADGLSEGDEVVVTGAQLLLSEELKSQISTGDDE